MHGAWVHLEYDINTHVHEFRVLLDCTDNPRSPFGEDELIPMVLPLVGTIDASFAALMESARRNAQQLGISVNFDGETEVVSFSRRMTSAFLNLALYLCASPDLERAGVGQRQTDTPRHAQPRQPRQPAHTPTIWDVGVRMGAALRAARRLSSSDSGQGARIRLRPHVRRAHWHSYWIGPREGDRHLELRWLHPVLVNVQRVDDLPAVVRPVS